MVALDAFPGEMPPDIYEVHFDSDSLTVRVSADVGGLVVRFRKVVGFRFLDEGDILEFWPEDAAKRSGWIYEVNSGGWKELESSRDGFLSGDRADVKEFFVATVNGCLSVLCSAKPVFADCTTP